MRLRLCALPGPTPFALALGLLLTAAACAQEAPEPPADREGVVARARHTAGAFASDLGLVASSPARLSRRDVLWAAGAVAATAVVLANDQAIADGFVRSRGSTAYDGARDLGERLEPLGQMVNTLPYWAGAAALSTILDVKPVQALCLDVLESHLVSGAIRNSAKFVAGRERPSSDEGPYRFWKLGTSFPSGHASVVFELATLFTRRTRNAPLAARVPLGLATYGLASCLAVERVDSGAHWPSDVVVGAVSGAVIAGTIAARNEERRALLVPRFGAAGQPVGAAIVWGW